MTESCMTEMTGEKRFCGDCTAAEKLWNECAGSSVYRGTERNRTVTAKGGQMLVGSSSVPKFPSSQVPTRCGGGDVQTLLPRRKSSDKIWILHFQKTLVLLHLDTLNTGPELGKSEPGFRVSLILN